MNEQMWMQAYDQNHAHIRQLQHEAEQWRLVQQARQSQKPRRMIARILYALGHRAYRLGHQLQHQYKPAAERPAEHQLSRSITGG